MGKPLGDLDTGDQRLDDRWTYTKLAQAGYTQEWEKNCRSCHEPIEAFRRLDGKGGSRLLILDAYTLTPHRC